MKNEQNHHINLLTDFGFKRFFGTEPYKNNLLHFLNTFIGPYIGTITDITYRPTEQLGFLPTNIFSDKMSFVLIDLSKFAAQMQFDQLLDDRERWCYSIHNMNKMEEGAIPKRYGIFHKLYEDCRLTKLSTMEKQEYEKSVLEYEDVKDAMDYHHRLGIEEGFQKGLEEGMEKGMEKSREALINAARKLVELGVPISEIVQTTGLSEELVGNLKS